MAYLKDKKLLFVHIPKNAGKSVEVALGLAPADGLSRMGRRNILNRLATFLQRRSTNSDSRTLIHGTLDYTFCAQHMTLQEMQLLDLVPRSAWSGLRTFAVCRNPYSRALSSCRHFWGARAADPEVFETFCSTWYNETPRDHNTLAHQRRQVDFVRNTEGKMGVDRVLRFESLADDFRELCRDWDIAAAELPHVGKQGEGSMKYRSAYTSAARALVEERFAEDIEYFGYGF